MSEHDLMQRIDRFDESLNELRSDIKYIRTALTGDDSIGMTGIVTRHTELEARLTKAEGNIDDLKGFKQKITGYIIGGSVGGSATITAIAQWLT